MERPPIHLNRYEIVRPLASGGFGQVYLARVLGEAGFYRTVAIKRIRPELTAAPEFVHDFIKEARIGGYLQHHNVVQVLGFERLGGHYALIMDYVDGIGLEAIVRYFKARGESIPLGVVAEILAQSADGLNYVHNLADPEGQPMQLVHRDLKPSNLLVSTSGLVKISDFGIARAAVQLGQQRTKAGMLKGTMAYFSPEQARGELLDHRTDLYAMGAILYELLALEGLFPQKDPFAVLGKVGRNDIGERLAALPEAASPFMPLLAALLTSEPADRVQTAADLAGLVRQVQREVDSPGETLQKLAPRWAEEVRAAKKEREGDVVVSSDPWIPHGSGSEMATHAIGPGVSGATLVQGAPVLQGGGADPFAYENRRTAVSHKKFDDSVKTAVLGAQGVAGELNAKARAEAAVASSAAGKSAASDSAPPSQAAEPATVMVSPADNQPAGGAGRWGIAVVALLLLVGLGWAFTVGPLASEGGNDIVAKPPAKPPTAVAAKPPTAVVEKPAAPAPAQPPVVTPIPSTPAPKPKAAAPRPIIKQPAVKAAPTPRPPAPTAKPRVVAKAPPPPPTPEADPGLLFVSSLPAARVFVDGKDLGDTPVRKKSLSPGTYSVRLSRIDLGFDKTVQVVVKPGVRVLVACSADSCNVTYP